MIPDNNVTLANGIKTVTHPTHTYKLNFKNNRISRYADGLEAMEQFVYKALRTERYQHEIYDWNYGVELDNLFGKPTVYVKAELARRISEALLADDRVTSVDSFSFPEPAGGTGANKRTTICVNFTVHTIFGDVNAAKEVAV